MSRQVSSGRNGMVGRMAQGRPGRPSKGERERIDLKVPPALKLAAMKVAAESGMTLMDFVDGAGGDAAAASQLTRQKAARGKAAPGFETLPA